MGQKYICGYATVILDLNYGSRNDILTNGGNKGGVDRVDGSSDVYERFIDLPSPWARV